MAVARAVQTVCSGSAPSSRRDALADRAPAIGDRDPEALVLRYVDHRGPAVDVAADPGRGLEFAQRRDRLRRPRAEQRVVAAEQEPVGAGAPCVGEHRIQRREVAVDVVEEGQHLSYFSNSIELVEVIGPSITLRYATAADAEALLELGSDPEVTRFFSWGPYTSVRAARRPTSRGSRPSASAASGSTS